MKVKPVSNFVPCAINNSLKQNTVAFNGLFTDIFTIKDKEAYNKKISEKVLGKTDKVDLDFYNKTTKKERSIISQTIDGKMRDVVDYNFQVGVEFKKYLDKKYGKDKYVFVSIGTSPAGIGKVLQYMGAEVKFLPMSALNADDAYEILAKDEKGKKAYKKFLNEQGISTENIKNSDKQYLFYDYAYRGITIKRFEEVLKNIFDVDTDLDNVHFIKLNDEIPSVQRNSLWLTRQVSDDYIDKYLRFPYVERYAGMPHLKYNELDKIDDVKKEKHDLETKKFIFETIYKLDKKGVLKNNPLNEKNI